MYLSDTTQEGYSPRFSEIVTPGDWPLFHRLVLSQGYGWVWLGTYETAVLACCRSCGALCCYSFGSWGERVRARAGLFLGPLPPFAVVVLVVLARARCVEREEEVSFLYRFVCDLPEGVS